MTFKHMEMYFMDNDAEGVRVAWFPSHVLKAIIVPRTRLRDAKQLPDASNPDESGKTLDELFRSDVK